MRTRSRSTARLTEYLCAPLVQLHLLDWAHTIARRWLYEVADEIRITALMRRSLPLAGEDQPRGGVPPHACGDVARAAADEPQFRAAVDDLWPYALGVLPAEQRDALASRVERDEVEAVERGTHDETFAAMHDEMTMVRRSAPAGAQW